MKKCSFRLFGSVLVLSSTFISKPLIAATYSTDTTTTPGSNSTSSTAPLAPNTSTGATPYQSTDVTTPKKSETIPSGAPSEVKLPQSGQELTPPGQTTPIPKSDQNSRNIQQKQNVKAAQNSKNSPNSSNSSSASNSTSSTASLAYPTDVTPTGTPDTRPPPPARPAASSTTPAQYKPGAANPPPSNVEQPRPPAYIPQSDQRPINVRPEDVDKDQFQKQQYD